MEFQNTSSANFPVILKDLMLIIGFIVQRADMYHSIVGLVGWVAVGSQLVGRAYLHILWVH